MPIPWLSLLTKAARVALPIVSGGVGRGLSANAIQGVLREQGMGIRRTTLLEMIRRLKDVEDSGYRLRTILPHLRPDPERLPVALHRLRRNYSFTVRVRGLLTGTELPFEQFVTIASDTTRSRNELEDLAQELIESSADRYGMDISEVQLVSGIRSGELGTLRG